MNIDQLSALHCMFWTFAWLELQVNLTSVFQLEPLRSLSPPDQVHGVGCLDLSLLRLDLSVSVTSSHL